VIGYTLAVHIHAYMRVEFHLTKATRTQTIADINPLFVWRHLDG
jgi:hypothetical protein